MPVATKLRGIKRGPTVFTPASIAGLVGWYALDTISTLFTDAGRSTPVVSDADPVGGVTDLSSAGNHLSQSTGGFRPLYKTNIVNGLPAVLFDGSDDWLGKTGISALAQPNTMFMVVQRTSALPASQTFFDGAVGARNLLWRDGTFLIYAGSAVDSGFGGDTSWHAQVVTYNTTTSNYWQDGVNKIANGSVGTNAPTAFRIGSSAATDQPLTGYVALCLVYNALLTSTQLNLLGDYAATRYAITWTTI